MEAPRTLPYDLEFLLRAAPHSDAAKQAIEVVAQKIKLVTEFQLAVARERLKGLNPAEQAEAANENREPVY